MTPLDFIILLLIAGLCGSLAQALVGYTHAGCLASIVLGFIGALFGTWMARAMNLPELLALDIGGARFPVVWSIIGAALFCAVLAFLSGGYRRPVA